MVDYAGVATPVLNLMASKMSRWQEVTLKHDH